MGSVAKYAEPKTAEEMGRLFQTFLASEFGWGVGGGTDEDGADLSIELDEDGDCTILVMRNDDVRAMRLSDEERAIVEALRAAKWADRARKAQAGDEAPAPLPIRGGSPSWN